MGLVMLKEKISSLIGLVIVICLMTLIGLSWGISISSGIPLTEISRVGILMKC
jgi:hypothetical protein